MRLQTSLPHPPLTVTIPITSAAERDLNSLEAEELQIQLRLIQLRKQRLLGRRFEIGYSSTPSLPAATPSIFEVESSQPSHPPLDIIPQVEQIQVQTKLRPVPSSTFSNHAQDGIDIYLPPNYPDGLQNKQRAIGHAPSQHNLPSSQSPADQVSRGDVVLNRGSWMQHTKLTHQGQNDLNGKEASHSTTTNQTIQKQQTYIAEIPRTVSRSISQKDPASVGNEYFQKPRNMELPSLTVNTMEQTSSQKSGQNIGIDATSLLKDLGTQYSESACVNDRLPGRILQPFPGSGPVVSPKQTAEYKPSTVGIAHIDTEFAEPHSVTSLVTPEYHGNGIEGFPQSIPRANDGKVNSINTPPWDADSMAEPPPLPPKVPVKRDEELALEMAGEEASIFFDNGQLEYLHPLLQEQLAEAMRRHMPQRSAGTLVDGDKPRQTNEQEPHDSGDPYANFQRPVPQVSGIMNDNSPDNRKLGSSGHKIAKQELSFIKKAAMSAQSERRGAKSGMTKKRDSVQSHDMERATTAASQDEDTCECGKARLVVDECYFCWPCDGTIFCKECWDKCPPHKKRRFGGSRTAGLPHEKSDPAIARKIFETLQADHSIEKQAFLHVQDEDTSWFGAGNDEVTGDVVFQDFGRYSRLMAETSAQYRRVRFPALVSFVGQTGAGKSSLIRLLIEAYAPEDLRPQVPVVGSTLHADLPTSGDVHLYADIKTVGGEQPILYADCEGLDGGERQPMGARSRNKGQKPAVSRDRTHSFTKHIRKQHHTSEREILWADTALKRSREYHVRHLYPRLLYTFSDVIVFVMKNPRVIENTIEQLLKWAAAALETSSNQPVLPHAIIVLNAFDNASDVSLWDVDNSTTDLMEKVGRAVHQNHSMRSFAEFWRERGKAIESVETLLLSYYSSVRVVRVVSSFCPFIVLELTSLFQPERGRPTLISEQVAKLYQEIKEACNRSRSSKHQLRMLLNSDELQPYLQYAFDHFSRNLDRPFDFVQASLANNPIPSNFGGNIIKLAIDIMELWKDRLDGPSIFKELSFMVSSCIMLDSARHRTLGPAEKVIAAYVHYCDDALEEFCNRHWPCEYVHRNTQGRCVNVKAGHQSKGHQLKSGKVLAVGSFESDFTPERYREFFQYCVVWNLRNLLDRLQEATKDSPHLELQKAGEIHRDITLDPFFHHLHGPESFISHTACYSCLISPPEHALPCGHVLCTPCVQAFGIAKGRCIFELTYCPLHHKDLEGQFSTRWPVFIKPHGAGVRIMSLDGGGIRGIIELTILHQIEKAIGTGLPIQAFFDLIVGTSTGGIIALCLGAHGRSVRKCIHHFENLCQLAFTKRRGIGIPGLEHIISFSNHSRYETTPIEKALQDVFGSDQNLFAGLREDLEDQVALQRLTKVGVTTVTTAGTVVLLANYNRVDEEEGLMYQFHRSEKPSAEIKTWQAARATSAAPTMFKPFAHDPSGQVYQDGALYYNCPVELAMREQRLIWPDMAENCPDVILSLGTGVNRATRKPAQTRKASRLGVFSQLKNLTKIAIDKIQSSLNSEQTWKTFVVQSNPPEHLRDRYIRLNLNMDSDPPRMDDVSQLRDLKQATILKFPHTQDQIKSVADRLLATSFYFGLDQEPFATEVDAEINIVSGSIFCRFAPSSSEIRSLGEALRKRSRSAYNRNYSQHNPYFVIQERRMEHSARQIVLSPDVIERMIIDGIFSMDKIHIPLSDTRVETEIRFCFGDRPEEPVFYPISGFPRCFMEEMDKGNPCKLSPPI